MAAFLRPPSGAPPYYGFPTLEDSQIHGFTYGKISDFEAEAIALGHAVSDGDGFVVAPDGSRAGLIWEVTETPYLIESLPPDARRWACGL